MDEYYGRWDVVAGLTKMQRLAIPPPADPSFILSLRYGTLDPHLAAVFSLQDAQLNRCLAVLHMFRSHLTSLTLGSTDIDHPSGEGDEDIDTLVRALPQLYELSFIFFAEKATDAGLQCKAPHMQGPRLLRMPCTACFGTWQQSTP
jgi:hypothetical protein